MTGTDEKELDDGALGSGNPETRPAAETEAPETLAAPDDAMPREEAADPQAPEEPARGEAAAPGEPAGGEAAAPGEPAGGEAAAPEEPAGGEAAASGEEAAALDPQVEELREAARLFFAGDFAASRRRARALQEQELSPELRRQVDELLRRISPDPLAIWIAVGSFFLFVAVLYLAWGG